MQVGTGDSALTVPFYEKCGFTRSHIIQLEKIERLVQIGRIHPKFTKLY